MPRFMHRRLLRHIVGTDRGLVPYLFLLPALLVLGWFVLYPAARIFVLSFQRYSFVREAVWVGLDNYVRLFQDGTFLFALINSFLYLLVTPILIVVSLGVAFLLDTKVRGVKFFRGLYFLPVVTPMIVVGIIWQWLLNEDVGLINYALLATGLVDAKVNWLTSYPLNLFSVMFVTAWKGLGYYAVIFLAGLMTIPKELEEVASLDGATAWQQVLYVKLPLLRPTIALVAIISSISALKVFDELYVMIPGAPAAEKTLVPLIYQVAFLDFRLGYASAISVVLFLITLAFSYLNVRYWERD
ncbi:MAG: sugar ABC transporter permease [Bacteroidetes bacterium]|nr:MAG: sugar ABC transporter permease [Bacteroidota bacterium]